MTETASWHRLFYIRADWRAFALIALFAVVIAGSLALRPSLISTGTEPAFEGSSTTTQATGGIIWAIAEAVFAGILLAVILLWSRLAEWLQDALRNALKFSIFMLIGAYSVTTGDLPVALAAVFGIAVVVELADAYDVWWIANDLLAVAIAIYIGALAGVVLGPVIIAAGFIGLSLYDYVFADRESWMFSLASWTIRRKLPALFVFPKTLRLDWDELAEAAEEVKEDEENERLPTVFAIGMADLALPAAFAVALAQTGGGLPLVGAVAGILAACFRVSWKMDAGGGAGLPPLSAGALGGWAVAAAIVGVIG